MALFVSLCAGAEEPTAARAVNYVAPQVWRSARTLHAVSDAVTIESIAVTLDIIEGVAKTKILVRLRNRTQSLQEAVLLLPVPKGAVVHSFDFHGASAEPKAELLTARRAKGEYRSIVSKLRDPALLEFVGCSLIRSSVFPVAPGGTQAVTVTTEHLLSSSGGMLEYVFLRTQRLTDADIPFTLEGTIRSARPISAVYSPTHPIRTKRVSPGTIKVLLDKTSAREPGSILLTILPESGDLSASLLAYPNPATGGGHFLLLAGLPAHLEAAKEKGLKREVTLVLDRSGSMGGEKIRQAKAALLLVLQNIEPGEAFNIITYNGTVERFSEAPVIKTAETEGQARAYIKSIEARGGTNLHGAVLEALRPVPAVGTHPLVILLSDGQPTVGVTGEVQIRRDCETANRHNRRIFTFGVGHDVNAPLLDRIALVSRGSMTCVLPNESVEVKVSVLFGKLAGPIFTAPTITTLDKEGKVDTRVVSDLCPHRLPDLYRGGRLILLGRYRGDGPIHFELSGDYLGTPRVFRFRFSLDKTSVRNSFVPRLWASRKIAFLIDAMRQEGAARPGALSRARVAARSAVPSGLSSRLPRTSSAPTEPMDAKTRELIDEIVRLSVTYGILTEYTAFLAKEGTDLSDTVVLARGANGNVQRDAVNRRSGGHAMTQQFNNEVQRRQTVLNGRNSYLDRNNRRVEVSTIQQVADLAFFRRGGRWIDSRVARKIAKKDPDEIVVFGSDRFAEVLARLASKSRQGVLSLGEEVIFELDGKVIRVCRPFQGKETEKKAEK